MKIWVKMEKKSTLYSLKKERFLIHLLRFKLEPFRKSSLIPIDRKTLGFCKNPVEHCLKHMSDSFCCRTQNCSGCPKFFCCGTPLVCFPIKNHSIKKWMNKKTEIFKRNGRKVMFLPALVKISFQAVTKLLAFYA